MKIKYILHISISKTSIRHKIHSLLRRADHEETADIIYRI